MFADSDFILAIIKESDWLKNNALKILQNHKGEIKTSLSVMIEIAIICKRINLDIEMAFTNVFQLISVDKETYNICMRAMVYINKYGLNVFDAFHAASGIGDIIISSDSAYDKIGMKRLKLEDVN